MANTTTVKRADIAVTEIMGAVGANAQSARLIKVKNVRVTSSVSRYIWMNLITSRDFSRVSSRVKIRRTSPEVVFAFELSTANIVPQFERM